jgi:hypothetical protein
MKKLSLTICLILIAGLISGQSFKKGTVVGFHVISVDLSPNVTIDQWKTFALESYIPAINKEFKGDITMYLADRERGAEVNAMSMIWVITSMDTRDKYFPQPDVPSDLFNAKWAKIKPIEDELVKLGDFKDEHYTDWIIK